MPRCAPSAMQRTCLIAAVAAVLLTVLLTMSGCGDRLSGRYDELDGWGSLEFEGDRVYITLAVIQTTTAADYEIDGGKVIVKSPGALQVYNINSDGTLEGGLGMKFIRRP